ncbi:MAG: nucleotidyltransferase domain-containing protein [Bdellovibrio sp.]
MNFAYTSIPSLATPLDQQISGLKSVIQLYDQNFFKGAVLFGSCCRGEATYRSDIDIMLIFDQKNLDYTFVQKTRDSIEEFFLKHNAQQLLNSPLPVEFQVVRSSVFSTTENEMKTNLRCGIILVDKANFIKLKVEALNEQP